MAKALIQSGQVDNVLMVAGDVPSKVIHPIDTEIRGLFSDGAAATFISNKSLSQGINASISDFVFGTDGSGAMSLWVERSGSRSPADIQWLKQFKNVPSGLRVGRLKMESSKIFLFMIRKVPILINDTLKKHELTHEDIDFYILHQANGTVLEFLRKKMKIDKEKFILNIEDKGNTVSATLPIAFKELSDSNRLKPNQKILVAAFGIGLSWSATILNI